MNDTTETCECGNPALTDANGFVTTLYNGMYNLPVCHDCWVSPENIAVEVLVEIAGPENNGTKWADLPDDVCREAIRLLIESLALRGVDGTDPDVFNKHTEVVAARWDEWYTAN